jgi:uncharacterized protein
MRATFMIRISDEEVQGNLALENPWWATGKLPAKISALPKRGYLGQFSELVRQNDVRRSVILLGPRRVGKTIMILQLIGDLLARGAPKTSILYVSLDRPLYNGVTLEKLVQQHRALNPGAPGGQFWFFFDEIQYLRNWEGELKSLTDLYDDCKFVASGSAAAALRAKSQESGAGRFTTFLLPPLTFDEFIGFQTDKNKQHENLARFADGGFQGGSGLERLDIQYANILFENYCAFGGYPEAVFSKTVQGDMDRFIREDIIDKVLLRDLPSIYGITDTRELNSLFTTLTLNTALEVSLDGLSQTSAVAKNTLKRYIDYLEAAFLIKRVRRIDQNARHFQRETTFKVYLTNPSLRAALFRPLSQEDEHFGHLAETAVFSQWFHSPKSAPLHYARWPDGEIDLVSLDGPEQLPDWFTEVKWSDRHLTQRESWQGIGKFIAAHGKSLRTGTVTSRSVFESRNIGGLEIRVMPTAIYAWMVGRNSLDSIAITAEDEPHVDEPQLF